MRGGKREDKEGEGLGAAGGNTGDHKKGTERGAMGRNTVRGGRGRGQSNAPEKPEGNWGRAGGIRAQSVIRIPASL